MLSSEKRSLARFLVIYLASTLLLFSLASWIFYSSSKHHLLNKQRDTIVYEAERIKSKLRALHQSNDATLYYPYHSEIDSAIYDLDKQYIFGTFNPSIDLDTSLFTKDKLYYLSKVEPYYLGAAYLLTARKIDYAPIYALQKQILFFLLLAGLVFSALGYFLGRLFVAPMRDAIARMNLFIQDTTHELNTPISTILTNIEMIETFRKHEENMDELKRIEIASMTLSRIYDDLTYLNLNHHYHRKIENLNMGDLLKERLVYFTSMLEVKKIETVLDIKENITLNIDKNDALRLIDNLLSNAIKYNKRYGKLNIILNDTMLCIGDTGIGMSKNDLSEVKQRFKRANKSEGGFGIGLHIVSQVSENYDFYLQIKSVINEGTEVKIVW